MATKTKKIKETEKEKLRKLWEVHTNPKVSEEKREKAQKEIEDILYEIEEEE